MNDFAKYIPQLSSIIVAIIPLIASLVKERNPTSKNIKKIKEYIDLYTSMPEGITAKKDLAQLLNHEVSLIVKHTTRKLNGANLTAVIFVAIIGGGLSYLCALWAVRAPFAWIFFAVILFFSIGVSVVGLSSIYEESSPKPKSR